MSQYTDKAQLAYRRTTFLGQVSIGAAFTLFLIGMPATAWVARSLGLGFDWILLPLSVGLILFGVGLYDPWRHETIKGER